MTRWPWRCISASQGAAANILAYATDELMDKRKQSHSPQRRGTMVSLGYGELNGVWNSKMTTTGRDAIAHCGRNMETRQIWGIWKLRPAYSSETPNLGQNRWCFVPCDLEIWWMTLENNRASLLCSFKLCATFHSHQWIQTGVTVRKCPIWVKFDNF